MMTLQKVTPNTMTPLANPRRHPSGRRARRGLAAVALGFLVLVSACDQLDRFDRLDRDEPDPPAATELEDYYSFPSGEIAIGMSGNVMQLSVTVDPDPYYQGGDLWAKSLAYLFIFSNGTRDALEEHPGLGGIRVRVLHPSGDLMSEAVLGREDMNSRQWREAIHIAGLARSEGSERPGRVVALVRWGEDHTEFEYNPDYISPN